MTDSKIEDGGPALTEEQCAALEQKARNCRDNARVERLVARDFMEEYQKGLSGSPDASTETHRRSMELYDFTIRGQHRARDYDQDADLFEAAAAMGRAFLPTPPKGEA